VYEVLDSICASMISVLFRGYLLPDVTSLLKRLSDSLSVFSRAYPSVHHYNHITISPAPSEPKLSGAIAFHCIPNSTVNALADVHRNGIRIIHHPAGKVPIVGKWFPCPGPAQCYCHPNM
jgi:hypothetical protein